MKVLITDNINKCVKDIISETAEAVFLPTMSEEEIIKIIGEYDALMVRSQTKVNRNIIEKILFRSIMCMSARTTI